jgi:heptosyltransferase-1
MGDVLLSSPVFQAVRSSFPKAWIAILTTSPVYEILKISGWVDHVFVYDWEKIKNQGFISRLLNDYQIIQDLKKFNFDLMIDLYGSRRSSHFLKKIGTGFRIGIELDHQKGAYDLEVPVQYRNKGSVLDMDRKVLELIGIEVNQSVTWKVPVQALSYADTFWKWAKFENESKVIAINPFASCMTKEWEIEHWVEVMNQLTKRNIPFFLTGAPFEKKKIQRLKNSIHYKVQSYTQTSLIGLMGLFKKAQLVISVDSGPRHLAAGIGTPTLTLFGPEEVNRWHPYAQDKHPVLIKELSCRPCGLSVCIVLKHKCMRSIYPEMVIQKVDAMLNSFST